MGKAISLKKKVQDDDMILFPEAENLTPLSLEGAGSGWMGDQGEGQLAVDVYETEGEIVIKSAIAGVTPENLEVFVHNDMLTVRGTRPAECQDVGVRHLVRECHWGSFSRSLILPSEIDGDRIQAELRNGVLSIRLPKITRSKKILVKES